MSERKRHYRVFRGGSWYFDAAWIRTVDRDYDNPARRYDNVGFRIVKPVPSKPADEQPEKEKKYE